MASSVICNGLTELGAHIELYHSLVGFYTRIWSE
jgi:hypothetical protein